MFVQVGLERERLVAFVTGKVFKSRVSLHVGAQVRPVSESLPAMGAAEGLLSRVGPHVTLEQPRPAEGLPADVTGVFEVMGQHVHGQGRHTHVDFVAMGAFLGALTVQ